MSDHGLIGSIVSALAQLHHPNVTAAQRRQAEQYLIEFRSSDQAWSLCLTLINHPDLPVQLFAAQTLRHKLRQQGYALQQEHLQLLRHALLQCLAALSPGKAVYVRQLCSAISALAIIDKGWTTVIADVGALTSLEHKSTCLQLIAEEGASDSPALTAGGPSQRVEAAMSARKRCLAWSQQVMELLLGWAQQSAADNQQLMLLLLPCASAWVRLGALHDVPLETATSMISVALQLLQAKQEQVVEAATAVLLEVAESAPDGLLTQLVTSSCPGLAAAACQAAAAQALHRAACWGRVAVALMGMQPLLLWGGTPAGAELRTALMQVTLLKDVLEGQLLCLPALELWGGELGEGPAASPVPHVGHAASSTGTLGGGSGSRPRSPEDADHYARGIPEAAQLELAPLFQQLLPGLMANWLSWQQQPEGLEALAAEGVTTTFLDTLAVACQVLGANQYMLAALQLADPQAQPATGSAQRQPQEQHLQQQQQQDGRFLGQGLQQYASAGVGASQQPQDLSSPAAADAPWAGDAGGTVPVSIWGCMPSDAAAGLAAAPLAARLQGALLMAAAPPRVEDVAQEANWGRKQQESNGACRHAAQLVLGAASLLHAALTERQQVPASCLKSFCRAVQVWSPCVLRHGPNSAVEGLTILNNLLQLLLTIAERSEEADAVSDACGSVRAVLQAAAAAQWDGLHVLLPLLLQAIGALELSSSSEQELLHATCTCLGGSSTQQRTVRWEVTKQLMGPGYTLLQHLQAQVLNGSTWDALGPAAEGQLLPHLTRGRILLEHTLQQLQLGQAGVHARPHLRRRSVEMDPGVMESGLRAGSPEEEDMVSAAAGLSQRQAAVTSAAIAQEPALQVLLVELWPLLHLLCGAKASGRLLQVHAKCVAAVLKVDPCLALPHLAAFLEAAPGCFTRPGGSSWAEPLVLVLEACSDPAADWPPDSRQLMFQALQRIWSQQQVLQLADTGAGDQQPHLSEHYLRLATAFLRQGLSLQPPHATLPLVDTAVSVAAACAAACHKKVSSCSLNLLAALLAAAAQKGGTQEGLLEVLQRQGVAVMKAALLTLLAPSPLPRVHKVTSLLLELVGLGQEGLLAGPGAQGIGARPPQLQMPQLFRGQGSAAVPTQPGSLLLPQPMACSPTAYNAAGLLQGASVYQSHAAGAGQLTTNTGDVTMHQPLQPSEVSFASSSSPCQPLLAWLVEAVEQVGPQLLPPQEAQLLLQEWGPVLGTGAADGPVSPAAAPAGPAGGRPLSKGVSAARSYLLSRRLKRLVRDFAERHSRAGP